jgi:hypothetical protein
MYSLKRVSIGMAFLLGVSACGELAYKRGGQPAELAAVRTRCQAAATPQQPYEKCMELAGWSVQRLDEEIPLVELSVNPDNRATEPVTDTINTKATTPKALPAGGEKISQPAIAATPPKRTDPLDLLVVNSWWKMGGTPAGLEADTDACVAKLGKSHAPVPGKQAVSRGLVQCLREQGWYGASNR